MQEKETRSDKETIGVKRDYKRERARERATHLRSDVWPADGCHDGEDNAPQQNDMQKHSEREYQQ